MKKLTTIDQLKSACTQADELVYQLKIFDVEYHPKEVKSLVAEYKWTTNKILSLCEQAINNADILSEIQLNEVKKINRKYKKIKLRANL